MSKKSEMGFRFKAYCILKKNLGEIDAIVECLELASLNFLEYITKDSDNKKDIEKNIQTLSKKHNIKVDYVEPKTFENRVMLLHIVSVYEQLECYYDNIIDQHPLIQNRSDKKRGVTLIDFILNKTSSIQLKDSIEYNTLEYYRLIRNKFSHVIDNDKQLISLKEDILTLKDKSEYFKLNAPNDYKELKFDDFILFTRCVKKFSQKINELYTINNEELKELILKNYKSKLTNYLQAKDRLRKLIKQLLIIEYNIRDKELEDLIIEGLA